MSVLAHVHKRDVDDSRACCFDSRDHINEIIKAAKHSERDSCPCTRGRVSRCFAMQLNSEFHNLVRVRPSRHVHLSLCSRPDDRICPPAGTLITSAIFNCHSHHHSHLRRRRKVQVQVQVKARCKLCPQGCRTRWVWKKEKKNPPPQKKISLLGVRKSSVISQFVTVIFAVLRRQKCSTER